MLDKLKNNGIQTWFLMANDEGHGYAKKKNQDFLFYSTILFVQQFLLGDRRKRVPALRRLDVLVVLGPVWAIAAAALHV